MNIGVMVKKSIVIAFLFLFFVPTAFAQQQSLLPVFSTYFGASGNDLIYDVTTDSQGNIIVTGMTDSKDFPVTVGSPYQNELCGTSTYNFPDAFVSKFSANGKLLWSRLLGGHCYDEAYSVETDAQNNVYIAGMAEDGFPTTSGTIQPNLSTNQTEVSDSANGFITKLNPDGAIIWSTYYGGTDNSFISSIALDSHNNIYGIVDDVNLPFPYVTANAYDTTYNGSRDVVIFKLSADGTQTEFASYLGGTGFDGYYSSLTVGADDSVYVGIETDSDDIPVTQNALQQFRAGRDDMYIAHLNSNGTQLLYATYLGGSESESSQIHALRVDRQNNIFITGQTRSSNFPTTAGVLLRTQPYDDSPSIFVSKISPNGSLAASTFLGLKSSGNIPTIELTSNGSPIVFVAAEDWQIPLVPIMPQTQHEQTDLVYVPLSSDLSHTSTGGYYGGSGYEFASMGTVSNDGSITLTGITGSIDIPTFNAYQPTAIGEHIESVIAHIAPANTSPTPTGPAGCPLKSQGDADCHANSAGKSINLLDYAIWYLEFINKCSSTNLAGCGPDSDGDGNVMDANFNYPGTNYVSTDNKIDTFDYTVWIQGFANH